MAQRRLRDYKDPLGSFEHNLINLGVHSPGRFCGFDTMEIAGQFQFNLLHTSTGINTFDNVGDPYGPLGVVMSSQGLMVVEDAPITGLLWEANSGNPNDRIDYVVMSHQYLEIDNPGATATYSILKGSLASTIPPVLVPFQVIIGRIDVPTNAQNIADCTYTKWRAPDSGDGPDARLLEPNDFYAINQNQEDSIEITGPALIGVGAINLWDLSTRGNSFVLNPQVVVNLDALRIKGGSNKNGTEITIIINQFVRVRNNIIIGSENTNLGYAPIRFASRYTVEQDQQIGLPVNVLRPPAGPNTRWFITLIKNNGGWYVKSLDGVNFEVSTWKKGMTVEVTMTLDEIPNHFDNTGLGINDWVGWAIKNGLNGSGLDRRGRIPVGATNIPAQGAPPVNNQLLPLTGNLNLGVAGGENSHILIPQELPKANLRVPGITGGDNSDNNNQTHFAGGDKPNGDGFEFFINLQGGNDQPHNNMQAYEATFWVVRIV